LIDVATGNPMTLWLALSLALSSFDDPLAEVEIVPVEGPPVKVAKFSAEKGVVKGVRHLGRGEASQWAIADLLEIRFPSLPPTPISGIHLRLANDEVLRCSVIESADADEFLVRGNHFGGLKVSSDLIVGGVLDADADERQSERAAEWMKKPRTTDALLFKNFDEAKGSFAGIGENSVDLDVDGAKRSTPRGQVLALAFDPRLLQPKTTRETYLVVRLNDGTRLRASRLEAATERPDVVTIHSLLGTPITVKREHLVDASVRNGRVTYLSDLEETETTVTPYLDDPWPVRRDRAATGEQMRLGGRVVSKGLGMRSGTRITFPADGYARFQTTVGLDDAAGPLAHVVFAVFVDGKRVGEDLALGAGDQPKALSVPLAGAKTITLAVEFGKRGDVQDFADWGDARLVK
jgi:hypothetical protein